MMLPSEIMRGLGWLDTDFTHQRAQHNIVNTLLYNIYISSSTWRCTILWLKNCDVVAILVEQMDVGNFGRVKGLLATFKVELW